MRARYRLRAAVNLANGSTLAGLGVTLAGRARLSRAPDGLLTATGYRLPVPPVPAFTLGNVVLTHRGLIPHDSALFRHEARHATQYAWCGGVLMLPMYFAAAGASWLVCGDFGAWNLFERGAGLAEGGYPAWPPRPVFARLGGPRRPGPRRPGPRPPGPRPPGDDPRPIRKGRSAAGLGGRGSGPGPAARDGSRATVSR